MFVHSFINLDAGLKRKLRANKASAIKEDRQGFGIVLSGNIDLEEALQYPLTTFPLSLTAPETKTVGQCNLWGRYMI